MTMKADATDLVWCDGGPWDQIQLAVEKNCYQAVIYGHRTNADELLWVEHIYHRFGNVAVYDGWRRAE